MGELNSAWLAVWVLSPDWTSHKLQVRNALRSLISAFILCSRWSSAVLLVSRQSLWKGSGERLPVAGFWRCMAIQVILADKPAKILAAYLLPSRSPTDRSGPDRDCGGLLMAGDLNANHVDWNSRLNTRRGNSYVIMLTRTPVWSLDRTPQPPTHKLLRYSRYLGHWDSEGPPVPGVSDIVLCTKLGPHPGTHCDCVSLILSTPTGSPWFQAHRLGQLPNSLGRSHSVRSRIAQRDGNRHVRWELLQWRSEGSGGIYS